MSAALSKVERFLEILAGVVIALLMLITVVDVALRTMTGRGLAGAVEYSEVLLVIGVALGLGAAESNHVHVRTGVLADRLRRRSRDVVRRVGAIVPVICLGMLLWASGSQAITSTLHGELRYSMVFVPVWPARILLALGFLLVTIEFLRTTLSPEPTGVEEKW